MLEDFKLRLQYTYETLRSAWRHRKHKYNYKWAMDDIKWAWTCDLDVYNCCHGYKDQGGCGCHGMTNRDVMQRFF